MSGCDLPIQSERVRENSVPSGRDKQSVGSSDVVRMFVPLMLSQPSADLEENTLLRQK